MGINALRIRDVVFGEGMPKICVPIVAEAESDILKNAEKICGCNPDCVEWRMDWFCGASSDSSVLEVLRSLREIIGGRVLLATFRTKREGGQREISAGDYRHLYEVICESGCADMIDIEGFLEEGLLEEMCELAHKQKVFVVASNHDFEATPAEDEMVRRLELMDRAGADIPKLAVMPSDRRDVLTLLSATLRYRENGGLKPVITMSMGSLGMVSRMTGEIFDSAMTFASVDKSSAPGQLPVEAVRDIMNIIHEHY